MAAEIDIADLVRQGVAIMVATRDGELQPELSGAWGPALSRERVELRLDKPAELTEVPTGLVEPTAARGGR